MSVSIQSIHKTFGTYTALDDISLEIPNASLTALLGPSGSGKTTLLRIVAGLEFADPGSGRVLFHGEDVTGVPAGERGVGFVFQHYALFKHMSVAENIAFGLTVLPSAKRPAKKEIANRVKELLRLVKLDGLDQRRPTNCPAASDSASPLPAPSPSGRRSCCSTSLSARSMPRCARTSAAGCANSTTRSD
jgi:sulfate transport system ATP-binding protein